jgi:hypothetical protein
LKKFIKDKIKFPKIIFDKMENKKELIIEGERVICLFLRKKNLKRITISISSKKGVSISYPWLISQKKVEKLIKDKSDWIIRNLKKSREESQNRLLNRGSRREYLKKKNEAYKIIMEKLNYYNQFYNFDYKRVSIRNQRTRWGSCSSKKNLNFNYRVVFLPSELVDYLVVHELCHLKEMNHSKRFWELVEQVIPDCKKFAKRLRKT